MADIERRLRRQQESDVKDLRDNYSEQNRLLSHVARFRDLERDAKAREERIQRIVSLIGEESFSDLRKQMKAGDDTSMVVPITVDTAAPLWMSIRAIVEQVSEIQVVELQHALGYFGKTSSRQAVESALASHRDIFDLKTRGRAKFVSLKR